MKNRTNHITRRTTLRATLNTLIAVVTFSTLGVGIAHAQHEPDQSGKPPQINLNLADAKTLQTIPGIGPSRAEKIITTRAELNGFKALTDLLLVPGIGTKLLQKLQPHLTLQGGITTLPPKQKQKDKH